MKLIVNWKLTVTGSKVEWLNVHWIVVKKEAPFSFKYHVTHNDLEQWNEVSLQPKRVGRRQNYGGVSLPPLYYTHRPINPAKLKDLHSPLLSMYL